MSYRQTLLPTLTIVEPTKELFEGASGFQIAYKIIQYSDNHRQEPAGRELATRLTLQTLQIDTESPKNASPKL
jgi:hypothetical protein